MTTQKRLFVFITGQYRTFWHSWNNLVETLIKPSAPFFEIYVYVGMDSLWKRNGHLWHPEDRQIFQTHLQNEWANLQYPSDHLVVEWIGHDNPHLRSAIVSLQHYRDTNQLDPYWFDYLVYRSGSCTEYAQIAHLYERVCSHHTISPEDLMIRTRTDLLFRHPFCLEFLSSMSSMSSSTTITTQQVLQALFPSSCHFSEMNDEPTGREVSIFPSPSVPDRWIITLRKNLVYIMPLQWGKFLLELVQHYGDWDTPQDNHYWFNAESQFRGCFRTHQFTLWEYSQNKDECYGNFENLPEEFPLYAIYR